MSTATAMYLRRSRLQGGSHIKVTYRTILVDQKAQIPSISKERTQVQRIIQDNDNTIPNAVCYAMQYHKAISTVPNSRQSLPT